MTAKNRIDPEEAFAFLNVVAPKLEQLRRRLVAADKVLKAGDPETARLSAITESQLAVREFLGGIPHLSSLVDPIDALLDAVREEPEELPPPPVALAPDPADAPPEAQGTPAPVVPAADAACSSTADRWLQVGTALAVHRLVTAGMSDAAAELHVRDVFAAVNLRQRDAGPIDDATIKEWRSLFTGGRKGWRGRPTLRRKAGGSFAALTEAKKRVAEMAATFKQMSDLGAGN